MKHEILQRMQQLGASIGQVKDLAHLPYITFNTVLYRKPEDSPWQSAEDAEPIYGISDFISENESLLKRDPQAFYDSIINKYFQLTEEGYGQVFWQPKLFTPFKKDTEDFEEWNSEFTSESVDLSEITKVTNETSPDFIILFYSYGFPDTYFICLSDPNPENPTVFSTDHETYFSEVTNEGQLEIFLTTFITKEELIHIVKKQMEK